MALLNIPQPDPKVNEAEPTSEEQWLAELDAAIDRGLEDEAAGRTVPAEDVLARLKAKYAEMSRTYPTS